MSVHSMDDCFVQDSAKLVLTGDVNDIISNGSQVTSAVSSYDSDVFHTYEIDCQRVLLSIKHPATFYFQGVFNVQVLTGSANVFGYVVESGSCSPVYSLPGSSALYLSTESTAVISSDFSISSLIDLGLPLMSATKLFNASSECCIVLLEKLKLNFKTPVFPNICSTNSSRIEQLLNARLDFFSDDFKKINIHTDIKELPIQNDSRFILCGGQGVGKSTMLRFMVNRALNSFKNVLYIDTDIGQSEFTLPETISAVLIENPLFGPPFTHFKKPLISYCVGTNNAVDCVESYNKSVKSIIEYCQNNELLKGIPWFVNTLGFCKGIGIVLLGNTIHSLNPTCLIQIEGGRNENYPSLLTHKYISSIISAEVKPYAVKKIKKYSSNIRGSTFSNKEMRWLGIQAYFSSCLRPSSLLMCPTSELKVMNCKTKRVIHPQYYSHLSTKIVTLCHSNDKNLPTVVDHGFIVGYDMSSSSFIIFTPAEDFSEINGIYFGSLEIPNKVNKVIDLEYSGLIPYVQVGISTASVTKPAKRTHRFLFEKGSRPG